MHYFIFAALALTLAFFHFTRMSSSLAGPDLSLALLAWCIIASSERMVLIRAWFLGMCMDMVDPGSHSFYMLSYTFLAVVFLPMRSVVFQRSYFGWFLWAASCHILMSYMNSGQLLYADWSRVFFDAICTGIFAIMIGFFANELPRQVHPLGGPDVP
ncbi:MAG: hypothetical protein HRU15_19510 [Planctomycetes bacterium]|nr:hypothetical protein [Planctomycetota bacterium]